VLNIIQAEKFCAGDIRDADQCVAAHMCIAVDSIRNAIPSINSIYLAGGFGRGEGTVIKIGNQWKPLNDYDIWVVSDKFTDLDAVRLNKLKRKLAISFGIDYVDIAAITKNNLREMPPTIENFEMLNGAMLLWGYEVRESAPKLGLEAIEKYEFVRLVCNRAAGILTGFLPERMNDGIYMLNQKMKAYIAAGDCMVYLHGNYSSKYSERYVQLTNIFKNNKIADIFSKSEQIDILKAYRRKLNITNHGFDPCLESAGKVLQKAYAMLAMQDGDLQVPGFAKAQRRFRKTLLSNSLKHSSFVNCLWSMLRSRAGACALTPDEQRLRVLLATPAFTAKCTKINFTFVAEYFRQFWWLPTALRMPPNPNSVAKLWEQFCH
jgi:hypothetical protein